MKKLVTLLSAAVPLMEIAANQNEAPCGVWRLAEVLDQRERYEHVSSRGAAAEEVRR